MNLFLSKWYDKPLDFWVKWAATLLALVHVYLTAHDVMPYYKYTGLVCAMLWCWLGHLWEEPSVVLLNLIMCAIYIQGIVTLNHWIA